MLDGVWIIVAIIIKWIWLGNKIGRIEEVQGRVLCAMAEAML